MTESNRREFLITTAAVGGGMALSLYLPGARAEDQIVGGRSTAAVATGSRRRYRD